MKTLVTILTIYFVLFAMLNPIDNTLANRLVELDRRLAALERAEQPYLGDWTTLSPSEFSYNSATEVDTSRDFTDVLQLGDKLRIIQNSTTKYFYLIKIDSGTLYITAGDEYTFTSDSIESMAFSRLGTPAGFPATFTYTATLTDEDGTTINYSTGEGFARFEFLIQGNIVTVVVNILEADIQANTQIVRISTPFLFVSTNPIQWALHTRIVAGGGSNYYNAIVDYIASEVVTPRIDIRKEDLSNWATGDFNARFTYQFKL